MKPRHTETQPDAAPLRLRWGRFELQTAERRLLVDGAPAALQARALDLLIALARRPGQLMGRQSLLDQVWGDRIVEEGNLNVQINALRRLLGPGTITTVPGHGYRLDTDGALPAVEPRGRPGGAHPPLRSHLPAVLPPLLGRGDALRAAGKLLDAQALVTLTGATGIGKTRLAQALLHERRDRHEHGVCFVDLASVTEPAALSRAVAVAVGVTLADGGDATRQLAQSLAPLDLLLALDNAEHLLDAVADLARSLVGHAPRLRLLVTSQAPLRVGDEWLYRLGALAIPAGPCSVAQSLGFGAVALFDQRARAVDPHFQIDDQTLPLVVDLCRRLDGTPLAIELAARQLPVMGLPALVAALDHPLHVLTAGARGVQPRHRSLRAALTWSHRLLSPTEQQVFRRLAVFEGSVPLARAQRVLVDRPWTADAAPGLCETQVLQALAVLVERSLVVVTAGADPPRLRLPYSPRALAMEALHASGEKAMLLSRQACSV